jgi:serine/threonine protein kinase
MGIEPFTPCTCSACGADLVVPLEMGGLLLEKPLYGKSLFSIYEGFDTERELRSIIFILSKDNLEFNRLCKIAAEEASSLSVLHHPNICPITNFGEIDGNFFVTEPLMDGYGLSDYLSETQGPLDVDKVIDILQAVVFGLAVAHHKEFVHHDICPQNIHIDARGNVRTKNFFISRFTYDYLENKEELACSVPPYFISPEKAEKRVEDKCGDVFSFGVLFYYMLTGKYPFSGKNDMETVYSRVKKKKLQQNQVFSSEKSLVLTPGTVDYIAPLAPAKLREEVPEQISDAVLDMLSYRPAQRPRFTEILNTMNLYMAREDREKVFHSAQLKMVRESINTKTKVIPVMKKLYSDMDFKK